MALILATEIDCGIQRTFAASCRSVFAAMGLFGDGVVIRGERETPLVERGSYQQLTDVGIAE
eukprot:12925303-Prorocentrum_lima.AAC.1